jgi:transcriptional regulator with XRE-family HTH domain
MGRMESAGMGAYIKARRERLGWTLTALAAQAELSKSELSALEAGKINWPGADKRRRLALALGVSHLDLVVAAGELTRDEAGRSASDDGTDPECEALVARLRRAWPSIPPPGRRVLSLSLSVYEDAPTPAPAPQPDPPAIPARTP